MIAAAGRVDGAFVFPFALPRGSFAFRLPAHFDAAVQDGLLARLRQLAPGRVQVVTELLHDLPRNFVRAAGLFLAQFTPGADAAFGQRLVLNYKVVRAEFDLGAQAVARGAHAQRRVKAEHGRCQLGEAQAARRARVLLREEPFVAVTLINDNQAIAQAQGSFDRVGEAAEVVSWKVRGLEGWKVIPILSFCQFSRHYQPVYHEFDVVLLFLVQLDLFVHVPDLAVHPQARKAIGAGLGKDVLESAFAVAGQRGQHLKAHAGRQRRHPIHDLLRRLSVHPAATRRAVRRADAGKEHPQVIIDLCDRGHRRARVLAHRLLLDGNRRAEAADEVHFRFFHLGDELAGVGRERLDVAALALGVEGIEGQRRLATARDAGDHHQLEARKRHVNVLEVVFLGPTDENFVVVHGEPCTLRMAIQFQAFLRQASSINTPSIPSIPVTSSHIYAGTWHEIRKFVRPYRSLPVRRCSSAGLI